MSKINMAHAEVLVRDRKVIRRKRDVATQNMFRRTNARATFKGMKINVKKTQLLVVSDAKSYKPEVSFKTSTGEELVSEQEKIKILGFTFDGSPTLGAHVEELEKKTRRRYWVLRHLNIFGFDQNELQVYKSVLRPVIEYCSNVYHSMLTQDMLDRIERLQYQALKCVYGYGESYRALREKAQLELLSERRETALGKFAGFCPEDEIHQILILNFYA